MAIIGQKIMKTHDFDRVCVFSQIVVADVKRFYPRCVGRRHSLE